MTLFNRDKTLELADKIGHSMAETVIRGYLHAMVSVYDNPDVVPHHPNYMYTYDADGNTRVRGFSIEYGLYHGTKPTPGLKDLARKAGFEIFFEPKTMRVGFKTVFDRDVVGATTDQK